ncbi:pseudouridine synthase [Aestuariivivens sediminicola]|uniref:pseudouridine synthase n=1 Tax=Aestuariivivens sediminicola TaxID=2913560 RepID=UPI001F585485|nr:pseudouridine synthase [Aestuariivivens sediminicola]
MNRHQGSRGKGKPSGRGQNTYRKTSYARGNSPIKKRETVSNDSNPNEIRLNKYIANSGICSRREADVHIATGLVTVNGKVVTEMGYKVKLNDDVRYDGARVNPEKKAYVLLNKPKGFATTTSEGKGSTVMDLVANATSSRIKPIGRLGRNSKGLLLFTNDEVIINKFTNSKHGVPRLFHIQLNKNLKYEDFKNIQNGFKIDGKLITVEEISYISGASKKEIGLKIKNTGNTIIRTIFEHFNYDILSIDCVAIAHLTKKDLPRGHWKHLTALELNNLRML